MAKTKASQKTKKRTRRFIQQAIKHPGTLRALAHRKRKTNLVAFCRNLPANASTKLKRKCNFYLNVLRPAVLKRQKSRIKSRTRT